MSDFKLKSIKHARGRRFTVEYTTPTHKEAVTEEVVPSQLRTQLAFWQDRAGSVEFTDGAAIQSDDGKSPKHTPQDQFDQTAQTEAAEAARIAFLVGQFPTWPTVKDELMAFAKKAGVKIAGAVGEVSDAELWERVFGEVPPVNRD